MEQSLRHCSRASPSLSLALLLLHVLRGGVPLPAAAAAGVRVGVVLDLTSDAETSSRRRTLVRAQRLDRFKDCFRVTPTIFVYQVR